MPYLPENQRAALEPALGELAAAIRRASAADPDAYEGLLNYAFTQLALQTIPARRYRYIARVTGALENAKQEFYRRFAGPYEDEAAAQNGDVYLP